MGFLVLGQLRKPIVAQGLAARADAALKVFAHFVGNEKLRILRPPVVSFRKFYLFFAQRFSVSCVRVLFIRSTPGDMAVDDHESRPFVFFPGHLKSAPEHIQIIRVAYARDVPAVSDKTRGNVITESPGRVAFDGYFVVVVNPAEVRQPQMTGERRGFVGNPFHHAAVSAERIGAKIKYVEPGAIKVRRLPARGDRHTDTGGDSLPQGAGRGFDAG